MAVSVELHHIAEAIAASRSLPEGLATKQDVAELKSAVLLKLGEILIAVQNPALTDAGEAALAQAKQATAGVTATGVQVDAKVEALNAEVPTPAT